MWPVAHLQLLYSSQSWKSLLCSIEPVFVCCRIRERLNSTMWRSQMWSVRESQRGCDTRVKRRVGLHGLVQPRRQEFPQGQAFRQLSEHGRADYRNTRMWQWSVSEQWTESWGKVRWSLSSCGGFAVGGGNSSSCFSCSASSFDQAYSGKVALGGTVTPTQQGGTEGCIWKQFFFPPGVSWGCCRTIKWLVWGGELKHAYNMNVFIDISIIIRIWWKRLERPDYAVI